MVRAGYGLSIEIWRWWSLRIGTDIMARLWCNIWLLSGWRIVHVRWHPGYRGVHVRRILMRCGWRPLVIKLLHQFLAVVQQYVLEHRGHGDYCVLLRVVR